MRKTITLIFSLLICLSSFSQTFCLKLSEVSNDGSTYVLKIEAQGSELFKLGSANLQFSFPENALGSPSVVSSPLVPPFYQNPSITVPLPGQASYNIELASEGFGIDIAGAPEYTEIGVVSFPITNAANLTPLSWSYNGGTTQTVIFADDEETQLFVTDPCCLMFESLTSNGNSAVRLTSVNPETQTISMRNFGTMDVDVSGYRLCSNFDYTDDDGLSLDTDVSIVSGDFLLQPNEEVVITWNIGNGAFRTSGDDMGVYMPTGSFGSPDAMVDYMQYLIEGARQNVAVEKGIWTAGEVVTGDPAFNFSGATGDFGASFWSGTVPSVPCAELIISEYGEPNGGNGKYLELYNPTDAIVDLSEYEIWKISNGGDWPEQTFALSGSVGSGGTVVIANNDTDVPGADLVNSGIINFNGDDAMGLAKNGVLIDAIGTDGPDVGAGWEVAGVASATANNTLVRKNTVLAPNINWAASAGTDETNSEWTVVAYSQENLGLHTTECVTGVIDSDDDGIADADDNCPNDPNPNQEDLDGDLIGDVCDNDIDGDGELNGDDCDPMDANIFDGASCDDGDPMTQDDIIQDDCTCAGTPINMDTDEDGVFDVDDNCPNDPNPNQEDLDGDMMGDVCDDDVDGDGVANGDDCAPMDAAVFQGATCDDGNPESIGDVIQADCTCAGIVPAGDCDAMMISEYGEPNGGNGKYIELYNASEADIDLAGYEIWKISNGGEWPEQTMALTGTVASGATFVIGNNIDDVPNADMVDSGIINFNGDDAMALAFNSNLLDVIGTNGPDVGSGWDVAGVTNATANFTLVRKSSVLAPTTDWAASAGTDEASSQWNVVEYSQDNLGAHASDCDVIVSEGCTDEEACNYDVEATLDDGSCILATGCDECDGNGGVTNNPEIGDSCDDNDETTEMDVFVACGDCQGTTIVINGCTDSEACNYDATATNEDDSCVYATGCDECDGNGGVIDNAELGDSCDDGNELTSNDVIVNCDGTCQGTVDPVSGCTSPDACNYNPSATIDDESCVFATGCDECDGNGGVIDNPEVGDTCDDGNEETGDDVYIACGDCQGTPPVTVMGCTDSEACNYSADANDDDGSCVFATGCDECDGNGGVTDNPEIGESCLLSDVPEDFGVVNEDCMCEAIVIPVLGCTNAEACNFDSNATEDDGSCVFATGCDECDGAGGVTDNPEVGDSCDDGDETTTDDVYVSCGTCMGTAAFDCPELEANIGDECDDGNDDLFPGTIDENCECIPGEGNDCTVIEPTTWGGGPWHPVAHGSFTAQSSNDAILATGDGQLMIEVFNGECGGASLGIYNTVGAGSIERVIVGDFVAGNQYSYTVFNGTNIQSKVKTYADSRLEDFDCNVEQALVDQIYALREESLYANPAVQVTGFAFRFEDVVSGEVIELVDPAVDGFYQQLSAIPGITEGHTYSITVRHRVLQIANGVVANLWSDYGSACLVTISDGVDPVPGCTIADACNYDADATANDGSCVFATGCDECDGAGGVTDNPEVGDACDDGDDGTVDDVYISCDVCEGVPIGMVPGCIDMDACNFDEEANADDGSCYYVGDECDDNDPDTNNDLWLECDLCQGGVAPLEGCTVADACNYNPIANIDDGSCVFATGCDECDGAGGVTDNPEVGDACDDGDETTTDDVYVACGECAGTPPGAPANDLCADAASIACGESSTGSTATATAGADLEGCTTAVNTAPGVWYSFTGTGDDMIINTNGSAFDTKLGVYGGSCDALECISTNDDGGEGLQSLVTLASEAGATYYAYVTGFSANAGDYVINVDCPVPTPGCTDAAACNFDEAANVDDGSCEFATGCDICFEGTVVDNPEIGDACDDGDATTENDMYVDCGECAGTPIGTVLGCTDELACNYDAAANTDDESCAFPGDACDDGDAGTVNDAYGDDCVCAGQGTPANDLCDGASAIACGESSAGSTAAATVGADLEGCTTAVNTAPGVWYSFTGTGDDMIINTNGSAFDTKLGVYGGSCDALECISTNDDGGEGLQSLVTLASEAGATYYAYVTGFSANAGDYVVNVDCPVPTPGCTDAAACNFDEAANVDDGSCEFATGCDICFEGTVVDNPEIGDACDDGDATTENDMYVDCGECAGTPIGTVLGCTDELACNYDAAANTDDESCAFPGDACDDGDAGTVNDAYGDDCVCVGQGTPANDLCDGAAALDCGGSSTGSTAAATVGADLEGCATAVNTAPGVWYSITGTGLAIVVNTDGSAYDTKMGVYSGTCDALVCIGTDDDGGAGLQSQVTFDSEAGATYYVYVTGFSANAGDYVVSAACITDAEGCTDAAACNFNSEAGVDDGSCVFAEGCDTCTGETDGSGTVVDNPEVGDACDDGNPDTSDDVVGANCICSGSAGNQTCANAEAVGEGMFTAANPNAGGGGASLVCQTAGAAGEGTNAVWYAYTASFTGDALITSCLGGQDTRVSVFAGTCDELGDCIASDDDTCPFAPDGTGNAWAAEVTVAVTAGETYLIEWDDRWATDGFDWSISDATPGVVDGDDSETASSLSVELGDDAIKAIVYPNPNSGENVFVNLSNMTDSDQNVTIEVMDIYGKKVYGEQFAISGTSMTQELRFNSSLASGMYLVQISANGQSVVQKLTIK